MIGEIIERVKREMTGRMADEHDNVRILLEVIGWACDGDYIEIGVLHGGSLCAVALLKKKLGHKGTCYGIDPLNGYYIDYTNVAPRGNLTDPITKLPVCREIVDENIAKFELDNVEIIQAYFDPLPHFANRVAVAYIDGDHWGEMPTKDWLNVCNLVTDFIVFDNVDDGHPDVMSAVELALKDERWELDLQRGISCVLRRTKQETYSDT